MRPTGINSTGLFLYYVVAINGFVAFYKKNVLFLYNSAKQTGLIIYLPLSTVSSNFLHKEMSL